jgi:SAM-dependent methyltransferase
MLGPMHHRAVLTECMDEPCTYANLRDCLRDIGHVGSITGVHRTVLRWLDRFAGSSAKPLRILDAGCGGGHLLRHIEQWASRKGIPVSLIGIDLNSDAICAAQEFTPPHSATRWAVGDATLWPEPVDLIVSSYLAHHLDDAGVLRFLNWMENTADRGWLVHDLYRSRAAIVGFRVLALAFQWHSFVQQDGATSIRRAFVPAEWQRYVEKTGIPLSKVRIHAQWPVRICVSREKDRT